MMEDDWNDVGDEDRIHRDLDESRRSKGEDRMVMKVTG
jgi:hypothetical protein